MKTLHLPRLRLTLGQLIKLVALLAVGFAVVRTPFGPLVLGGGIILVGFAIDRAHGGAGFRGGILASVLGYGCLGLFQRVTHQFLFDAPSAPTFGATLFGLMLYIIVGAIVGFAVSLPAWMVLSVNQSWSGEGPGDNDRPEPVAEARASPKGASDR